MLKATDAPSRARKIVKKGTVIYSTVRPYLLNVAIIDRYFEIEPIASTAFAIIHPWDGVLGTYVYHYLRSPHFIAYVESVQIGMAYPAISDEKFYARMIPLPPTEEQSRIVTKVDKLMALCDKLEAQQQERAKMEVASRKAVLRDLTNADAVSMSSYWERLDRTLGCLFGIPESIDDFEASLKGLAVRGLLTPTADVGRDYFAGASKQTTNLASINMTQLRSFPLPIPPLVEQKAILEKLAALTMICRTWRAQLEQARRLSALLAAASVSAITGVRIEEEEELKVPKTELISKLRLGESPGIKEQAPLAAILTRQNGEMAARDLWQRFGGEIDAFYAQLKLEVGRGWILEPAVAEMREVEAG